LVDHNTQEKVSFTKKYRPWKIAALFQVGKDWAKGLKIERFIKKQKSRKLLEKLVDPEFKPEGKFAHLVRVPHVRD